jgi:hypothetical protein
MSFRQVVLAQTLSLITGVCAAQTLSCIDHDQPHLLPDAPSATKFAFVEDADGTVPFPPPPSQVHPNSFLQHVKRGIQDQKDIYTAPFHKQALKWDLGVAAVTSGLIVTDPAASRKFADVSSVPSRKISDVGLYGTIGTVGGFYLLGTFNHNEHVKETGMLGAEAIGNAAVTYTILKLATDRERPEVGAGNGRFWHYNRLGSSFPSGHSALTWAGATVIAHEYPKRWVQILAYGTATSVAFTRYSGREHFPSDVFLGSVVGYFIGRDIFNSHCREGLSDTCHAH